jgi:phospholipase/carboxylesterase
VPIENESILIEHAGWVMRIRHPVEKPSDRVLLLLHGWTGDENSMWLFTKEIPKDYWVIAPQAPYSAGEKGYSWRKIDQSQTWGLPNINEFQDTLGTLMDMLNGWASLNSINMKTIDLMGFSQGAALVCAILLLGRENVSRAACLAGFMPEGGRSIARPGILKGKKIFVSHGIGDEIIPLNRGQEMVKILKYAGADVDLCAEDVGHKVGINCFKGLKEFFNK